jgi:restriction system protein
MEILLLIALALIAFKVIYSQRAKSLEKIAQPVISATIAAHSRTLYIKREQLKCADPYGNVDYSKFIDHVGYFVTHVVARDLEQHGIKKKYLANPLRAQAVFNQIALAVVSEAEKAETADLSFVKTGIDYEFFCKRILEANNWEVLTTPASGDQGADLIATKNGVRVIFQCKFYGQPVGNKAVQEAHAAKAFQKADFAIVVTNASFTPSALQLAQSSGVHLIHHQQLSTLESLIGEQYFSRRSTGSQAQ